MSCKIDLSGDLEDQPYWWKGFINYMREHNSIPWKYPESVNYINQFLSIYGAKCITTSSTNGYVLFENNEDFVAFKLGFGI